MERIIFEGKFSEGVEMRLTLFSYIEENVHVIYSPHLDLYGYGNDEEEARRSFSSTIEEYITFTHENNTLEKDLEKIGWKINRQSGRVDFPQIAQLLQHNPHFGDVLANRPLKTYHQRVSIPAFA